MSIKKLYLRIRYWRQLRKGFGLLEGKPKQFELVGSRAFITNGVDPMVKVDLRSGIVQQYDGKAKFSIYYTAKANPPKSERELNETG